MIDLLAQPLTLPSGATLSNRLVKTAMSEGMAEAAREAYFVGFAREIRAVANMPVMVVGGFRSRAAMVEALERGDLDLIGLSSPLIAMPDGPARLLAGEIDRLPSFEKKFDIRRSHQMGD